MIIGIDIGGANTKAASSDGRFTHTKYLPLWRDADLEGTLKEIKDAAGSIEAVGVTITGELADCFATKKEGIDHISGIVRKVFPGALFFGSDGKFYGDTPDHTLFSAANWMASASFAGSRHRDIIFIDVGSTTSDIIPIKDRVPLAGKTDFERLARGELIYSGSLRTNIAALLQKVEVKGLTVRTSSELFAVTADAYLLLGRISEQDYTCDTPDGGSKDRHGAALRLARVVCCDLEELSEEDAVEIARQVHRRQVDELKSGIGEVIERCGVKKAAVCGLGSFLVKDALLEMGIPFTMMQTEYGEKVSRVFPAYAVACLLAGKTE